ncbi:glutamate-5-semialdehyde dehydrogenase [bacterium]|nr:glutamate-5-semialdehyde dehydrogenase [bacterium]
MAVKKEKPIQKLARLTREASSELLTLSSDQKNQILMEMAEEIKKEMPSIIKENEKDLKAAKKKGLKGAMLERLELNEKRVHDMAKGLVEVAKLPDPVGQIVKEWERPNGLKIRRMRIPLGVIAVVYESRPNVTVDAAGLCFKSGNAVILRGGSEAFYSNQILGKVLQAVLKRHDLDSSVISLVPSPDRKMLTDLLKLSQYIDVVIPRGGEGLMRFMEEHSSIPIIKHDKGVCNLFVDESADMDMARVIVENSKVQRPGVCNALENLLIHEKIAPSFLPMMSKHFNKLSVELRADKEALKIVPTLKKAKDADWDTEYLDLILSVKVVKNIGEAINFIRKHGSKHTEAIVTQNADHADLFIRSLDSSCIVVNASTRFNDGGELGLGAEIGISTTKLHAFGPMGLEELTTTKFVVKGDGQVRI